MKFENNSSRLKELDVLRGFAALNVVLFHYTTKFREEYGHHYSSKYDWPYGQYGVQLFFVISGFVIFLTLQNVKSAGEFAYKRFTRLYPTYWICLFLTFGVVSTFGLPGREVSFKDVIVGLTMLQGLFKFKNVDGAYWSLLPELMFYLMMGLIFSLKLLNKIRIIGVVWMIIIIFSIYHRIPYIHVLLNLEYGMFFFAGIMFYRVKSGNNDLLDHFILLLCFIAALLSNFTYSTLIVDLIIFSLFYLFVYGKLIYFCNSKLVFLGVISYPLYLLHQVIGFVLIRLLSGFISNEIIVICIVILFIILLAWLVTEYLEKPTLKILRKKYQSRKKRPLFYTLYRNGGN